MGAQAQVQAQAEAQTQAQLQTQMDGSVLESRKLQELIAGLRPRFELLEGEMAQVRLWQSQHETPQASNAEGIAAVVMRLTRLESDLAARANRESLASGETNSALLARVSRLEVELTGKHDALSKALENIRQGLTQEFEHLKHGMPSNARELAELRQQLHGGLGGSRGICQRVASLEADISKARQLFGNAKAEDLEQLRQSHRALEAAEREQALQLEAWQNRLCEGVSGWQHKLAAELRGEVRTTMQSLAAAIKALDERLWQLDGNQSFAVETSLSAPCLQSASPLGSAKSPREVVTINGGARAAAPAAFVSAADELAASMSGGSMAQSPKGCGLGTTLGSVPNENFSFPQPLPQGSGSRPFLGIRREGDAQCASALPVASEHAALDPSAARLFAATSPAWRSLGTPERSSSAPLYPRLGSSPISCFLAAEQTLAGDSAPDKRF